MSKRKRGQPKKTSREKVIASLRSRIATAYIKSKRHDLNNGRKMEQLFQPLTINEDNETRSCYWDKMIRGKKTPKHKIEEKKHNKAWIVEEHVPGFVYWFYNPLYFYLINFNRSHTELLEFCKSTNYVYFERRINRYIKLDSYLKMNAGFNGVFFKDINVMIKFINSYYEFDALLISLLFLNEARQFEDNEKIDLALMLYFLAVSKLKKSTANLFLKPFYEDIFSIINIETKFSFRPGDIRNDEPLLDSSGFHLLSWENCDLYEGALRKKICSQIDMVLNKTNKKNTTLSWN